MMTVEPVGRPMYDMLADMRETLAFIDTVGGDEFERRIQAEIREAMDAHGVRVVLWYAERMDNVTAVMEEFSA